MYTYTNYMMYIYIYICIFTPFHVGSLRRDLHFGAQASSDDDSHCVVTHTGRHGQNGKRLRDCCALPIARGP